MSIEINLLPWREAHRQRRTRRFYIGLLSVAVLALMCALGVARWYQAGIDAERGRLALIERRMQALEQDIATVKDYRALRARMLEQIGLIRELQFSRPQTVRIFDQLAATLVDGVYYERLVRKGDRLELSGLARSNRRVSEQLRQLAASPVFGTPALSSVQSSEGDAAVKRFQLSVEAQTPRRDAQEAP
ncbi:type IV pilus assembly protein PilN [Chromohalobacter marismortui]|uniref:Type IV pilus assembly protein PilN n=1 Tax=Chromohalobacter marismortui TaxID=42055 RepID=A0A4V3F454_9GAMM|nr:MULTISPECIES: PilN domain-containing protein [Chromohalobacter]MCI0509102.1 PilN domain-containing protein [Chromohalobacter sp.]MCI0592769.1 PilN domain-containing protein [Chromohalobacter sp.]TDU24006.1 type IV pilus assembly protein PilN [Chromohalobacter marismortui]